MTRSCERGGEHRILRAFGSERDGEEPDLRLWPRIHARSERGGEELDAETHSPERDARANGLADQLLLGGEPRQLGVVVGGHRPAHRDDRVEPSPVGERFALVELDAMELRTAFAQHVLEDARRLAGDVLEDRVSASHRVCNHRPIDLKSAVAPTDSVSAWLAASHCCPLLAISVLVSGCGADQTAAEIPASASLAPADAVVFARITTDADSSQWQRAESVLERIPGVRDGLVSAIEQGLSEEGLDWETDVAPALGDEVVIVATAQLRPIVLLEPESEEKLDALLAKSDEETVRGEVEGRVALAEKDSDLVEYRAALERGTIEDDEAFTAGLDALPDESLGLVWVDLAVLTDELSSLVEEATQEKVDLGIDWLSASLSAEDDGLLVAMGMRTPGGGDTHYEPELFRRVPADAVAAVSFGGTQGTLDRLQGQIDLGELSRSVEEATGVSLDGIFEALSGEGVLYVRPGADVPDVTLALAPPDPDETWSTVDRLARKLATEMQTEVTTTIENGVEVSQLVVDDVTLRYARLDADTIVVTSDEDALALLTGDGAKLADSEEFRQAAEDVGLEDRTKGFVYVDVDGLLPLIESLAGESIPAEARDGVEAVDSLVFQTSGDGDTTTVERLRPRALERRSA